MPHRRLLRLLLPLLVLAACGEEEAPTSPPEPGSPAFGHTAGHRVVNSLADPGNGVCNATQCTLREAINAPGSTEISFAPGLTGTITLARPGLGGGTLVIEKSLSITGPPAGLVIRRRSTDAEFRIFRIAIGVTAKLANLTIQGGQGRFAGGIVNQGTLTLTNCAVTGNFGGIANRVGALTLINTRVSDNFGGGIGSDRGPLVLTNSTVADNSGGGIFISRDRATLTNIRIVGNSGDGIIADLSTVTLANSTVARNSGNGIRSDFSIFTIRRSTIAGNSGTGLRNEARFRLDAVIALTNSTVSGNSGGGIFNFGINAVAIVRATNSTITRNSGPGPGGGISLSGSDDAFVSLANSLVAQNSAPTEPDVSKGPGDVGVRFSLIGDGSGSGLSDGVDGNQVGTASSPIDPKLGALADNGGATRTHALLVGSPAIDAASTPDCPATDQRGVLRPQGAACDIGSYERR